MTEERPQTYNEWVQTIENNDPGVVAQMIMETIEREREITSNKNREKYLKHD